MQIQFNDKSYAKLNKKINLIRMQVKETSFANRNKKEILKIQIKYI